jgi:hypothetical protein
LAILGCQNVGFAVGHAIFHKFTTLLCAGNI